MSSLQPSPEQKAVLDMGLDTIRIRAGAGTGKTTTVALVIANLVENHGVDPEQILGITFTNKAASELADKVKAFLGSAVEEGRQAEVHTYHGFAAQILAEFGALAGVDTRVRVITPTFSRQILSETYHHTTYDHLDITNPHGLDKIRTLGDRMGDHLVTPDALIAHVDPADEVWAMRAEMLKTLQRYDADKRRLKVVDYSDLVTLSTRLLTDHPELVAEIRGRYQVVILDEYQDTNPAQRVLLTTVFGPSDGQAGIPVIAVGDEDQTIYEWRGASAENFELFPTHFPAPDGGPAKHGTLTLNRRSAPEILEVANEIRRRANPAAEDLVSHDPDSKGEVVTYWAEDAVAEADWIARRFDALHQADTPWSEMAVLFRKNKDFSVVVDSFARHDIPVEVANLGGLLSVPEVADLRAWLTVLDRPGHSPSLVQILFGSRYRLGYADIAPLSHWLGSIRREDVDRDAVPGVTLLEAIEHVDEIEGLRPEARSAYEHFLEIYRDVLAESQGASLVEVCRLVLDRTRAWQDVESLPTNQRTTARLNLYRLLDLAEDWSPLKGRPSLSAFLDYLEAMEDEPAEELDSAHLSGEEAVTLVTVHRAKGLEWDVVAIPAVTDKSFPVKTGTFPDPVRFAQFLPPEHRIDNALADMPDDEKERMDYFRDLNALQEWRVAYVAATRARSMLIMTGSYWYGLPEPTINAKKPSELFDLVEQHPVTRKEGHVDEPERPALLRFAAAGVTPDPLFEDGWDGALRAAVVDEDALLQMAGTMGVAEAYQQKVEEMRQTLFDLDALGDIVAEPEKTRVVSVTGPRHLCPVPQALLLVRGRPLAPSSQHGRHRRHGVASPDRASSKGSGPLRRSRARALRRHGRIDRRGRFQGFSRVPVRDRGCVVGGGPIQPVHKERIRDQGPDRCGLRERGELGDRRFQEREKDGTSPVAWCSSRRTRSPPPRWISAWTSLHEIDVTFAYLGGGLDVHTEHADEEWRQDAARNLEVLTVRHRRRAVRGGAGRLVSQL